MKKKHEANIETTGELVAFLKQFPKDTPIKIMSWVNRRPEPPTNEFEDYGTDLSGDEEFPVKVWNFTSRIIIEKRN